PHIDKQERGAEALQLLLRRIAGEIKPVTTYVHTNMLIVPQGMMTDEYPMKRLMDAASKMKEDAKVLNITVAGGFPYGDMPDAGMTIVVTTDQDAALASSYAKSLAQLAVAQREHFGVIMRSPEEALQEAASVQEGPVILVEGSDNVGGGAPADATFVLQHLKDSPLRSFIVIRDREMAEHAFQVGAGGEFSGEVGGKSDE